MTTSRDKILYQRVITNIPKDLLDKFDESRLVKQYSRPEAIKECMRNFVKKGGNLEDE